VEIVQGLQHCSSSDRFRGIIPATCDCSLAMHTEKNGPKRPTRQGDLYDSDTDGGWGIGLGTCARQWISVGGPISKKGTLN